MLVSLSVSLSLSPPSLSVSLHRSLSVYIVGSVAVWFTARKLTEDELNALIAHAHRRIEQLQRQVAEQMALESQRLEKALCQQTCEDDKLAIARVAAEAERLQEEFMMEKERWVRASPL